MFTFVMPDGERIHVEAWVYREWKMHRDIFFEPELGKQMDSAVQIIKRYAR